MTSRKRTNSDTYLRIRSSSARGDTRPFQDTRSDGGLTALEITDDHRVACSDHIIILAGHRRDYIDLRAVLDFAFLLELGDHDKQIHRLLRLQQLVGAQTDIALPIDGFTYHVDRLKFVISIDELQDIVDAGTFRSLKPSSEPSGPLLTGTSMASNDQAAGTVAHPIQDADLMDSPAAGVPMLTGSMNDSQWTICDSAAPSSHEVNRSDQQPKGIGKEKAIDAPATSYGTPYFLDANKIAEPVRTVRSNITPLFDLPTDNEHQGVALPPVASNGTRMRQAAALPPVPSSYGRTLLQSSETKEQIQETLCRIRRDCMERYPNITTMVQRALFFCRLERLLRIWIPQSPYDSDGELYYTTIASLKSGTVTATEPWDDDLPTNLPFDIRVHVSHE